jgi:dTDP-4-dehydrorhamnose reductase
MLGRDVTAAAERAGHAVTALARADLDVSDEAAVRAAVAQASPDVVVNCAAWTDVDGAEAQEERAAAVNATAPGILAAAAPYLVHVSTDYVFDGGGETPYTESAETGPRSAYGRTKLAGEQAVDTGTHAVVRSSWLFGAHGRNFVDTMLRLGAERDEVTVVDDQVGCPTFTGHLAVALVEIAESRPAGVLHVAGAGQCSWHDLAVAAFEETGTRCSVLRGRTADLGRPAPRPAYSVLATERPDTPSLPHWRDGLRDYLSARVAT